jgi:hypothetical protein
MAAWKHDPTMSWRDKDNYAVYTTFVSWWAPAYRGQRDLDCADLSLKLLVDYASANGLATTFEDNAGGRYISKAGAHIGKNLFNNEIVYNDRLSWSTPAEYFKVLNDKIGVEALWKHNTKVNSSVPHVGDLMIIWSSWMQSDRHHAALVYKVYAPGQKHPKQDDRRVPDFPGSDAALGQKSTTEYFKGTVDRDSGATVSREPDRDFHFDYLNSRGDAKRNAELIYFANARQALAEGFEFRVYSESVLDDWPDWVGIGLPPR